MVVSCSSGHSYNQPFGCTAEAKVMDHAGVLFWLVFVLVAFCIKAEKTNTLCVCVCMWPFVLAKDFRSSQHGIVLLLETWKHLKQCVWGCWKCHCGLYQVVNPPPEALPITFQSQHPPELASSPKPSFSVESPADLAALLTRLCTSFCWHLLKYIPLTESFCW